MLSGMAVLKHDLALALENADEILLQRVGRLAAAGSPEAVYRFGAIQEIFGVRVRCAEDGKHLFYECGGKLP